MATVTWAHFAIIANNRRGAILALTLTILFAIIFTALQGFEYYEAGFTIADGVYGSTFFMATGYLNSNGPIKTKTLHPYWVTGFADAESSFILKISKRNRTFPWCVIPTFTIELHERDLDLLILIQEFFGVGHIVKRVRNGKSSAIYSVQSVNDLLNKIIPHFNQYPMLTQKGADFILFSKAVHLINLKTHLNFDGFSHIVSLRASMNKGLTSNLKQEFTKRTLIERPLITNQTIKNPYWLVGFVDGEGCFYVKISKLQKVEINFSISQHIRDYSLLESIKTYFNCGVLETVSTRPNSATYVVYKIEAINQIIIPFFKTHSLLGLKSLDFNDFVRVNELKENLTIDTIGKIEKIKSGMNKGRKPLH